MKKLTVITLVVATAAATAYFFTKFLKKKNVDKDIFDDEDFCCDNLEGCADFTCDSLDVVLPEEDTEEVSAPVEEIDESEEV